MNRTGGDTRVPAVAEPVRHKETGQEICRCRAIVQACKQPELHASCRALTWRVTGMRFG